MPSCPISSVTLAIRKLNLCPFESGDGHDLGMNKDESSGNMQRTMSLELQIQCRDIYIYILTLHVHTPSMWTILHYPFAVPATCPSKGVVLESTLLLPWRFASNFRQEVNPEKPNRECGVKDY